MEPIIHFVFCPIRSGNFQRCFYPFLYNVLVASHKCIIPVPTWSTTFDFFYSLVIFLSFSAKSNNSVDRRPISRCAIPDSYLAIVSSSNLLKIVTGSLFSLCLPIHLFFIAMTGMKYYMYVPLQLF